MLRSLISRHIAAPRVARPLQPVFRGFHQTPITFKKKGKKEAPVLEEVEQPQIDLTKVDKELQAAVDAFANQAKDAKLGKSNPQIFNSLRIETQDGDMAFTLLAQTAVKGRNFIITVFDPVNTHEIINAVLASDLNMNPIADPTNKQLLKVPLPPVTTESKKEDVKHLKAIYEKVRNGHSHNKHSKTLASIRADIKNKIYKKKMTDAENKVWTDYEKLHKKYADKLSDVFKAAEAAIMK